MLALFSTCTRRRPAQNAKIIGHACEPTLHSSLFSRLIFTVHLPRRLYCCNRPFARWRHFITMTIILQGLIFLCKLGLLLVKPQWDYQIKIWKEKRKGILVAVVKWRHRANDLLQGILKLTVCSFYLQLSINTWNATNHREMFLTVSKLIYTWYKCNFVRNKSFGVR